MIINITDRQRKIIELLENTNNWVVSSEIARKLHISSRTVRNEINNINDLYENPIIISQKGKGYSLNSSVKNSRNVGTITQVMIKRQLLILKTILLCKEIDFYELADRMFISETTLEKEIIAINEIIQEKNVSLIIKRKNNKLFFEGSEESKRKIHLHFLIDEVGGYSFDFGSYKDYFHSCDILKLKEVAADFIKDENIVLSDLSLISLIIHIAIMLESVSHGNYITNSFNETNDSELIRLSKSLHERLKDIIDFELPNKEIYYMASLFSSRSDEEKSPVKSEQDYHNFIESLLNEINTNYEVDLRGDRQLINNLHLHLTSLADRIHDNHYYNNPLVHEIKENFPFTYDISVYISLKIQDLFNTKLVEDEIGFIALHIMCAIEKLGLGNKKRIIIINPYGKALTNYITEKIIGNTGRPLEITETSSLLELDKALKEKTDLIITTVNLEKHTDVPVYKCSFLLKSNEIDEINKLIDSKNTDDKGSKYFLLRYFDKDLFFPDMSFKNKEEAIRFLCSKLTEHGYTDDKFIDSVLKREEIAPTAFGNLFAIPHPAEKIALKNGIAVCILNKSIRWSKHKVKVVFLFSLTKTNMNLNKLYEIIVSLLEDVERVKKLSKSKDYSEFIRNLLSD